MKMYVGNGNYVDIECPVCEKLSVSFDSAYLLESNCKLHGGKMYLNIHILEGCAFLIPSLFAQYRDLFGKEVPKDIIDYFEEICRRAKSVNA